MEFVYYYSGILSISYKGIFIFSALFITKLFASFIASSG